MNRFHYNEVYTAVLNGANTKVEMALSVYILESTITTPVSDILLALKQCLVGFARVLLHSLQYPDILEIQTIRVPCFC